MSGEIIGRELEVGLATEAERGTAESSADKWMRRTTANIVERAEHADDDSKRGVLEDMEKRRVVNKYIEGDLEGVAHADAIGYLYASLYGKVASSNVSGSVYEHEFELKQDIEHQSLTVFAKDGDAQQLKFAGCMVNTLSLNAATDDFVRFTAGFVGKESEEDTESPDYDTEYDFIGKDITIKIADTEDDLSSADALKAKEVSIEHDQGLIRDHTFGSYTPEGLYNAKMSIEGEITLNFKDKTYKDFYLDDTEKFMQIEIKGDADIGGGENPSITYIFHKVQFNDWNRSGGADELVTQPISFKAYYNESEGKASKVTVKNLTESYENVPSD